MSLIWVLILNPNRSFLCDQNKPIQEIVEHFRACAKSEHERWWTEMMFYEVLLFGSDKSRKKGNTVFEPTKLIMATQLSRFTQNSKKSHFEECFYFLKNPFSNCNYALCEKRGNSHAWKSLGIPVFKRITPSGRKWEKWSQWSRWKVEEASEVPREIKLFQHIYKLDTKSTG